MITQDAGIEYEQDLGSLPVAIIVLVAKSNALDVLRPLVPSLLRALEGLGPRKLVRIDK